MTITTVLAADTTEASSSNIVVGVGEAITVGIFSATAGGLPADAEIVLKKTTPGEDNEVFRFGNVNRQKAITSPGVYHVDRAAYTGLAFGVFTDDGAA